MSPRPGKRSGVLELAVLGLLQENPMHGYELRKRLSGVLGTFHAISYGSLYPCLKDLESRGLLVEDGSAAAAPLSGKRGVPSGMRGALPRRGWLFSRRSERVISVTGRSVCCVRGFAADAPTAPGTTSRIACARSFADSR